MSESGPLSQLEFRRLFVGQTISALGDWMGTIALMALVMERTGSPTAVGGVLALRLAPALIAGPLVARATRGGRRRSTMLRMDLVRAGLVAPLGLIGSLWLIYVIALAVELASLVFLPARDAAVPDLVDDDQLATANGLLLLSSYGNIPIGAGVFALISVIFGSGSNWTFIVVFALDAATYLASYAAIRSVRLDEGTVPADATDESGVAAFMGALRHPVVRAVAPGLLAAIVGAGTLFSLGVLFVHDVLDAGNVEFGVLVTIFGAGGALGVGLLRRLGDHVSLAVVRRATILLGGVLMTMSVLRHLALAYIAAVFFGAAASTAIVGGITYLQEQLEGDERTLGLAVVHTGFRFGMSASALVAGAVVEHIPPVRWWLVGELQPASIVMFGAGGFIAAGGLLVRRVQSRDKVVVA